MGNPNSFEPLFHGACRSASLRSRANQRALVLNENCFALPQALGLPLHMRRHFRSVDRRSAKVEWSIPEEFDA